MLCVFVVRAGEGPRVCMCVTGNWSGQRMAQLVGASGMCCVCVRVCVCVCVCVCVTDVFVDGGGSLAVLCGCLSLSPLSLSLVIHSLLTKTPNRSGTSSMNQKWIN